MGYCFKLRYRILEGQRKEEREKINKKEKKEKKSHPYNGVNDKKKEPGEKNFFSNIFRSCVLRLPFFFAERFDGGRRQCYSGVSNLEMERTKMKCEAGKNTGLRSWQQVQAVYVHIPFCVQKCLYCDFASYACRNRKMQQEYVAAVCREIERKGRMGKAVNPAATVYFGGGTPSVLPAEDIAEIVAAMKNNGWWQQPAEATIEVNPGTADKDKLQALCQLGFDRVSFGVQSLQDSELAAIGRIHTAREALDAVAMAQAAGFKRINADVIYGLPQQTLRSLEDTLQQLTATGIEHLSVYGLILEEGTPLTKLVQAGKVQLPDEDAAADMYEFVQRFLQENGYERYEVSNYARSGAYSQHNLAYWRYLPYEAFGAAACAFDGARRVTATADVAAYIAGSAAGEDIYDIELLSDAELVGEFMFMNLRKTAGADLAQARERYGVDVWEKYRAELEPLREAGFIDYDEKRQILRLTESGMEVGNRIFEIFVTV